jgi:hypothetical protein
MRRGVKTVLSILVLAPIAFSQARAANTVQGAAPGTGTPVVLELFTSQGCSSCPQAEKVLSLLGRDESTRKRVIPLAFHVDYWNELGWFDPFSAREWSTRQAVYAKAFGIDSSYTPQLVVNGRTELNGSDGKKVLSELAQDIERQPAATVSLTAQTGVKAELSVGVTAVLNERVEASKLEALVVVFESGLVTPIGAGENSGRTLENDFVVRRLKNAFSLDAKPGSRKEKALTFKLDPAWKLEKMGVAAFLQDPSSMRIYGATAIHSLD